ncbi:MAG TPA: pilus assembly protein N-terminal domain-containing protein [Caulobacteraceae bacterium]|nr:pilus assembly protein N-terminal domain-containing protein [Caulobacteraceae bacterium]
MRPFHALFVALIAASAPLSALAAPLTVPVDQVRKLPFAGLAATVTPGNSDIADVFVVDDHTILVQGKKIGMTNLIVTDRAGRVLYNDKVVVSGADVNAVMISRGGKVTAYACEPHCLVVANPGTPVPNNVR